MPAFTFSNFDLARVPSPCYVVDEIAIENNLKILQHVQGASGAKILLALKAFSMFSLAPLIMKYLHGVCASGYNEARLGREEFNREVHTYSPAFKTSEFKDILNLSDHVVFNSFNQWFAFKEACLAAQARKNLHFGLRVNPRHSEGATPLYDPCSPGSRLGIPSSEFKGKDLSGISGLHFHTLCEQDFAPLERTLAAVEQQFGDLLYDMQWFNFGGGHHITRDDYQVEALINKIREIQDKYQLQVYLEPGEAIALDAGVFVTEVIDIIENNGLVAILDASATCHMPDVLEMPYRPRIHGAGAPGEKNWTYKLGGPSCLAGDVINEYSFEQPLKPGDRLMFEDMAIYTMVKNTTFNGIALPSIAIWNSETDKLRIVKQFGYEDFKQRLS